MKKHSYNKKRERPTENTYKVGTCTTKDEILDFLANYSDATCPSTESSYTPVDEGRDAKYDLNSHYTEIDEAECIKNISYRYRPYVSANTYASDSTAMTDPAQRGDIEYDYGCDALFDAMPVRSKYTIDIERANNTMVVDSIMYLEAERDQKKHEIDIEYNRRIYNTIFEFNTQARNHRDAVNMCVITDAIKSQTGDTK